MDKKNTEPQKEHPKKKKPLLTEEGAVFNARLDHLIIEELKKVRDYALTSLTTW